MGTHFSSGAAQLLILCFKSSRYSISSRHDLHSPLSRRSCQPQNHWSHNTQAQEYSMWCDSYSNMRLIWQYGWNRDGKDDGCWCDMPSDEALEVENLFVNCRRVFSYRIVERCDFVYRCDFVRMVQLRLDTGAIRKIRRLEVVNMWKTVEQRRCINYTPVC